MDYNFKQKKGLINRIKNIFKRKSRIYLLADGESLEIGNTMPIRPVTGFFTKIGTTFSSIIDNTKQVLSSHKIINYPEVYSNYPAVQSNKKNRYSTKQITLLGEGVSLSRKTNLIIPEEVKDLPSSSPTYVSKTLTTSTVKTNINGESGIPTVPDFNERYKKSLQSKQDSIKIKTFTDSHEDITK